MNGHFSDTYCMNILIYLILCGGYFYFYFSDEDIMP